MLHTKMLKATALVLALPLALALAPHRQAQAQGTAQVIVTGIPPLLPSPFVDDLRQDYEQGRFMMQFTYTGQAAATFRFRVALEKDGQTLVEETSRPATFEPGTYTYQTFSGGQPSIQFDLGFDDVVDQLPGTLRNAIIQGGILPEGTYTVRVEPLPQDAPTVVGMPGMTPFQVLYPDPPALATPFDGEEVTQPTPTFTWVPSMNVPATAQPRYEVVLVEMLPGQTPLQAIQANRAHYENVFRARTSFAYTPDLLPLEPGRRYAWRVGARASLGGLELPFSDEGTSEIYTFTYRPAGLATYGAPQLRAPLNDAVEADAVRFEWVASTGAAPDQNNDYARIEQRLLVRARAGGQPVEEAIEQGETLLDTTVAYQPGMDYEAPLPGADAAAGSKVWQVTLVGERPDGATETLAQSVVGTFEVGPGPPAPVAVAECEMEAPEDRVPSTAAASSFEGQTVSVGGFPLTIRTASGSAEALSGEGSVDVPYLEAPLAVVFANVSVNAAGEVYAGTVTAAQADGLGTLTPGLLDGYTSTAGELARDHLAAIYTAIETGNRMADQLVGSDPEGLPFGIAAPGSDLALAVVGARFTPSGSEARALAQVPLPGLNQTLGLGADALCLSADGFDGAFALTLGEDHTFTVGPVTQRFKAPAQPPAGSAPQDGTYLIWQDDQFGALFVELENAYPRDWLIPVDDENSDVGGEATASFSFSTDDVSDWVAEGTLERSEIAAAPGFVVEETTVFYDNSVVSNPADLRFPEGYDGLSDDLWTGLYAPDVSLQLPAPLRSLDSPATRLAVPAHDLIIDGQGVSVEAGAENLLAADEGDLGGWAYGIDRLGVSVIKNSFQNGSMEGGVRLPIFREDIPYEAVLTLAEDSDDLDFAFLLQPQGVYDTDLWKAQMRLEEASHITVDYADGAFSAAATLAGDLGVIAEFEGGHSIELSSIPFEGFTLRSERAPRYVEAGTWGRAGGPALDGSESDALNSVLVGFPIRFDDVYVSEVRDGNATRLGLQFDPVRLALMEKLDFNDAFLDAQASFTIWSKLHVPDGEQAIVARDDGFDIQQIRLNTDMSPAFEIYDAHLDFFGPGHADYDTYGRGFAGKVNANILSSIELDIELIFGELDDHKYWFFDAAGTSNTGIPIAGTGINVYGLQGGAYYGMTAPGAWLQSGITYAREDASTVSGARVGPAAAVTDLDTGYEIDPDAGLGFRAGVVLGANPPQTLTSDLNLEVAFTESAAFNYAKFRGKGYFLMAGEGSESVTNRNKTAQGTGEVELNFSRDEIHGEFALTLEPKVTNLDGTEQIAPSASGTAVLHLNMAEDKYFFRWGDPNGERVGVRYFDGLFRTGMYLYAGNDAPAHVKPVSAFCSIYDRVDVDGNGSPLCAAGGAGMLMDPPEYGFLVGASFEAHFNNRFLVFYGALDAAAGLDLMLYKVPEGTTCAGSDVELGSDGWYAQGQVYAGLIGEVGMQVDLGAIHSGPLPIASVGVAAELSGGLPKPLFLKGNVTGGYSVLGGVLEGDFDYEFHLGETCEVSALDRIASMEAITDVSPREEEEDVDVFSRLRAIFALDLDTPVALQQDDDALVRLTTDGITLYRGSIASGNEIPGTETREEGGSLLIWTPDEPLEGETTYVLRVNAYAQALEDGVWQQARDDDGHPIEHDVREVTFTTGKWPDTIRPGHVAHTRPLDRKRYALPYSGLVRRDSIVFDADEHNVNYSSLAEDTEPVVTGPYVFTPAIVARYVPVHGGTTVEEDVVSFGDGYVTWTKPTLEPSTVYAMQVVRTWRRGTDPSAGNDPDTAPGVEDVERDLLEDAVDTGQNTSTAVAREQRLVGEDLVGSADERTPEDQVLFAFHFGTSRHATLAEKVAGAEVSSTWAPAYEVYYVSIPNRGNAPITAPSAAEPFDEYDLYGKRGVPPRVEIRGARWGTYWNEYYIPFVREPFRSLIYELQGLRESYRSQAFSWLRVHSVGLGLDSRADLEYADPEEGIPFSEPLVSLFQGYGAPPLSDAEVVAGGGSGDHVYSAPRMRWAHPRLVEQRAEALKSYISILKIRNIINEFGVMVSAWSLLSSGTRASLDAAYQQPFISPHELSYPAGGGERLYLKSPGVSHESGSVTLEFVPGR